ncbi:glycoside hydrolase family 16 protein [Nocardioides jiangxiensis]|uniref:Glycoside hydrolase family 16 protein n=1 Tax=Nocardioides jiangxiensis TaxID=3064524 RepID=A0ABT9B2P6_9ACTN|nr:glycoside hydrolase family 16 protein [Nocardioides sp. WY-20]MDO7869119.1 glycoside hydrolase family 16 protein [Nocardioides sp. WY-20]
MRPRLAPYLAAALVLLAAGCAPGGPATAPPRSGSSAPASSPCGSPAPARPGGGTWTCAFADDFEGDQLDSRRWRPLLTRDSGVATPECRLDLPGTVAVAGGLLRLTARRLPHPVPCPVVGPTRFLGGGVSTRGLFSQTYGRFEIRARFPGGPGAGLHSALWLWPEHSLHGAKSGEIDIAEWRSAQPYRVVPTLHLGRGSAARSASSWRCWVRTPERFHTYVAEWAPHHVTITYDGRTCLDVHLDRSAGSRAPDPFDEPYFLVLNQAIGAGGNAPGEKARLPATMYVDYVHVWR